MLLEHQCTTCLSIESLSSSMILVFLSPESNLKLSLVHQLVRQQSTRRVLYVSIL